jgi:hypothetical protein
VTERGTRPPFGLTAAERRMLLGARAGQRLLIAGQ